MNARIKEIRCILMGRVRYQGSCCVADTSLFRAQFKGRFLGSGWAKTLGLREECTQYRITGDKAAVRRECAERFPQLGQLLELKSVPVCLAAMVNPILLPPVAVILEAFDDQILLCFYTAKSLLSRMNIQRTRSRVLSLLPDALKETRLTLTPSVVSSGGEPGQTEKKRKHDHRNKKNKGYGGQ